MRAILDYKYSGDYGALEKLRAGKLGDKLLPHLVILHTATASANKQFSQYSAGTPTPAWHLLFVARARTDPLT